MNKSNNFSVEANVSEANVKLRSGGRNQKIIDRV